MFSHPKPNSLFTFSPKHLRVKQRNNGTYVLKTSSQTGQSMTWFTDTPSKKVGKVPIDYFGYHFKLLFSESKPNASLNFRDKRIESDAVFEIKKASVKHKGDIDIINYRIQPIGKKSDRTLDALTGKTLDDAYLFIDNSTPSSGDTTGEVIAKAGGVVLGFAAFAGYVKNRLLLQASTHEYIPLIESTLKSRLGDELLIRHYTTKLYNYTVDLDNFRPEYDNFDEFQEFLSKDEFTQNILEAYKTVWKDLQHIDLTDQAVLDTNLDLLKNLAEKAAGDAYDEAKTMYDQKGYEAVSEFYSNVFNMSADEVFRNDDVLKDFDEIVKYINSDRYIGIKNSVSEINSEIADVLGQTETVPAAIESSISSGISDGIVSDVSSELASEALGIAVEDIAPEVAEAMGEFLLFFM